MGANGADVVLSPSLIQSHSCRTIGLNGNGIIRVTSIVICLADFSYGVLRSCEVKYKNVADDEVLVGSPSAVSGNTRRDCPTQCITHLKGCLCH